METRITTPLTFTLTFRPVFSVSWPAVKIFVNNSLIHEQTVDENCTCSFVANLNQTQNQISVNYYNKIQENTVIDSQGNIESDQSLEIKSVHVNDILLGSWFLTEGHYQPRYFEGFLQQNPGAPAKLKSQLIWHFPGTFALPELPNHEKFWWWYRDQRRYVFVSQTRATDRVKEEAYLGSLESHQSLIDEIKKIINV